MDTNSKILEDNNVKWLDNLNKWKKFIKLFYIGIVIIFVGLIIFMPYKRSAIIIILLVSLFILAIKNGVATFRDIGLFQEIYEIRNTCEEVNEFFERTNSSIGMEQLLGKNYKKVTDNLYKVEKHIYTSILKGKQNENMANELVIEVSKSLKNPVENIEKYINKIKNNKENYFESIDHLEDQANLLKHNIDELFELTKVMTGSIDLDIREIDIKNLLKQALVEYEDKFYDKKLSIKTNIYDSKVAINADGQQMWRVFEILLDNVIDYSKENTRVYVNLFVNEDYTAINLINISSRELNIDSNTFLKNIREDSDKNKMGLAIATNLINIQGGKLYIQIDGDMFKVEIKFKNKEIEKD